MRVTIKISCQLVYQMMIFLTVIFLMNLSINFSLFGKGPLILVGGGDRPASAMKLFSDYSNQGRILIIGWASEIPITAASKVQNDIQPHFQGEFDYSYAPPKTSHEKNIFLKKLESSTGVFFTGGDQSRILDAFKRYPAIKQELIKNNTKGKVIGGTSAGTAIMSKTAIILNSEKQIELVEGLGLLPSEIIVDQHFSQRNRSSRLIDSLRKSKASVGMGIDEDTALLFYNEKYVVLGAHTVRVFKESEINEKTHYQEMIVNPGESFELNTVEQKSCSLLFLAESF